VKSKSELRIKQSIVINIIIVGLGGSSSEHEMDEEGKRVPLYIVR
jgi:hypothetical protein